MSWYQLPKELQGEILYSDIETIRRSQLLNSEIKNLTNDKYEQLDRNLFTYQLPHSMDLNADTDYIVIYANPETAPYINYIKKLNHDHYVITQKEYLRIMGNDYGRASYVYHSPLFKRNYYVQPNQMTVREHKWHKSLNLTKNQSLRSIRESPLYTETTYHFLNEYQDKETDSEDY